MVSIQQVINSHIHLLYTAELASFLRNALGLESYHASVIPTSPSLCLTLDFLLCFYLFLICIPSAPLALHDTPCNLESTDLYFSLSSYWATDIYSTFTPTSPRG